MPHFTACGQSGMELYEETDGVFRVTLTAECVEEIGRSVPIYQAEDGGIGKFVFGDIQEQAILMSHTRKQETGEAAGTLTLVVRG